MSKSTTTQPQPFLKDSPIELPPRRNPMIVKIKNIVTMVLSI